MEELLERILGLAEGLAEEHFDGPPVDPGVIAERRGVQVVRGGPVARWTLETGGATVHLPEGLRPERERFTLAHELVELEANRASPPLPMLRDLADRAERLFQLGASELLMPRAWYEATGAGSGWDLAHLRELFEVSWEAAARRVPVCTPGVCTIVDNGSISARVGSDGLQFPRAPTPAERDTIAAAYEAWPEPGPYRRQGEGVDCAAWAALPEEGGIRRVCLLTHVEEG